MSSAQQAMRRQLRTAFAVIMVLGGTTTVWSVLAPLDSAVVTPGTIVVEGSIKKVQHPTGGIIGAINVREGQRVEEGDLLVRLNDTVTHANLSIVVNELTAARARLVRLHAERDGALELVFPNDLLQRAEREAEVVAVLDGERRLFMSRMTTRSGQKDQLRERVGQLQQEITGLVEQETATARQLGVAQNEFKDLRDMVTAGLVPRPRITALEREIARHEGERGEIVGRIWSTRGKISETELQILQFDKDGATDVANDLRETETKIGELQARKITAEDQLSRVEIRAPNSGMVHQLAVHTIGGVVTQSEPLMLIVPEADRLIVEVRINPQDIDQVHVDQPARIRFPAFERRTTPEVEGKLFRVAADLTKEPQTGLSYYSAGIVIGNEELTKLQSMKLVPGMPAEVFIKTGGRTLASYLLKPLMDQMERAVRER